MFTTLCLRVVTMTISPGGGCLSQCIMISMFNHQNIQTNPQLLLGYTHDATLCICLALGMHAHAHTDAHTQVDQENLLALSRHMQVSEVF